MSKALLGEKIGMTRLFSGEGESVPVTVVKVDPNYISQVKTQETDGYDAIQLAAFDLPAFRSNLPLIGHDAKAGVAPKRVHREVRVDAAAAGYEVGQALTVELFDGVKFVDVTGVSKGKGFQGPMKRHGFAGLEASHGVERKHRSGGSIGGRASWLGGGRNKKGIKMAGQMGNKRITVRSLELFGIDKEEGLLLIKGALPGGKGSQLFVREATRLYKSKARAASAS